MVPDSFFAFDENGVPFAQGWDSTVNDAEHILWYAKHDKTARAFLKFWLDAIEYAEATEPVR